MAKSFRSFFVNRVHLLVFLVFLGLSLFSLRAVFGSGDPVAFHDLSPMYRFDQLFHPYDFPWDYRPNLGTPSLLTGNAVYNVPLIGFSLVFGSVAFAQKVLLVSLMGLAGFGFYLAFNYLLRSRTAGFVAGLYMMFSPFVLSRWEYGHNTVLLAYAVLPFAIFCFFKLMREGGRVSLFFCGLLTALMIYASPQVAYMFILFALLYVVFDLAFSGRVGLKRRVVDVTVRFGLVMVISLTAAFPFFYQLLMVNVPVYATRAEEAASAAFQPDFVWQLFPQVTVGLSVIGAFVVLWWKSGFRRMYGWWKTDSVEERPDFLIGVNRQLVLCFALLGLLSVLLVVLVVPPFLPLYYWLFNNAPGFGMFREVIKFFMLSALSGAFFLGVAAEGFKRYLSKGKRSVKLRRVLPVLLISLIVCASAWQFFTGDVGGNVGTVKIPDSYQQLDDWLSGQSGNFRVAFFPPAVWATTYAWASDRWFMDPLVALQAKPTVDIQSDQDLTQSASLSRWVYTELYSNRTCNWGRLLSVLGVKYLIVRLDADMPSDRPELSGFSQAKTLAALNGSLGGFKLVKNFSSVLVYENPLPLPVLYQTDSYSLIVGDRSALVSLANLGFNFAQYPSAFLDDNMGLAGSLVNGSRSVFFEGDPYWSMIVSVLGEKYVVKPWNSAEVSLNVTNKWVNGALLWNLYNGDLNGAPDGYIYTEGNNTITIPFAVQQAGDYRILAQVYDGLPDSKGIAFKVDNGASFVFAPTRSGNGVYEWVEIANSTLNPQSNLQISNLGGPGAVSKIAVLPQNAVVEAEDNVLKLLEASNASVTYLFDSNAWNSSAEQIELSGLDVSTRFFVFDQGLYSLNLAFQSVQGNASVEVQIDGHSQVFALNQSAIYVGAKVIMGPVELSAGYHTISINGETGSATFSTATLTSVKGVRSDSFGSSGSNVPAYTAQSGSEFKVNASAKYLAFLEAGNSYWELHGSDGSTKPIVVFNYGDLFSVPAPGQYLLSYQGLDYWMQGAMVSVTVVAIVSLGLAFPYLRRLAKGASKNGS